MDRGPRLFLAVLLLIGLAPALAADTLVVANKSDHTVDLIDPSSGESRATLATGEAPHEVAVSPDGSTAVIANYGDRSQAGSSLTVIDLAGARVLRTVDLGRHTRPHGVEWISSEKVAVTTEGSAHLLVVDPHMGTILQEVETGQQISHMVAVSPNGRRALVANIGSGNVTAVDLEKGVKLGDIETGAGAEGIAITPDGSEFWVGNRAADTLSILDATTLETRATLECPGFPIRITPTPDGSHMLVSAAESGEVVVFDRVGRREVLRRKLDLSNAPDASRRLFGDRFGESPVPVGLVVSPDGERAYVAATQADVVVVIEPLTLEVVDLIRAGREPDGMAYSPLSPDSAGAGPIP